MQDLPGHTFHHRTLKWWKRAAFHLLNLVCVNAYIIYCESRPCNKLIHELFLVEVAKGLLIQTGPSSDDWRTLMVIVSLIQRKYHLRSISLEDMCCVCSKKKGRKKVTSRYRCKSCKVALCPNVQKSYKNILARS